MHCLVTGGFGFLGSRIASELQDRGWEVTLTCRCKPGEEQYPAGFQVVKSSWDNLNEVIALLPSVDAVVLAAGFPYAMCQTHPVEAVLTNAILKLQIMNLATKANIGRLINLSSMHVFSSYTNGSFCGQSVPDNSSLYAKTHLYAERSLATIAKSSFQWESLRLANIVGFPAPFSTSDLSLVAQDFCRQAIRRGKIVVTGRSTDLRNFISIEALLEYLMMNLEGDYPHRSPDRVTNFISEKFMSLSCLANMVSDEAVALGLHSEVEVCVNEPFEQDTLEVTTPEVPCDNSLIDNLVTEYTVRESLRKMLLSHIV